jgi:hypothetical protein
VNNNTQNGKMMDMEDIDDRDLEDQDDVENDDEQKQSSDDQSIVDDVVDDTDGLRVAISVTEQREAKRISQRPEIDHLEDAITVLDDGRLHFVPKPGEKVIIERVTTLTTSAWLDTRTYTVIRVHSDGRLELIDEEFRHQALSNYITGTARGFRFKIPSKRGPAIGRRKRGRPRKYSHLVETKPAVKKSDGLRRVYDFKGDFLIRYKNDAFAATLPTMAKDYDRLSVISSTKEQIVVRHPTDGWEETWKFKPGV